MEQYKGYFIDGEAKMVHPFSPEWYVAGSVLKPGRLSSIWKWRDFSSPSLPSKSKNWQNGSGWESADSPWMSVYPRFDPYQVGLAVVS
jgi:hypothetical protein